MSSPDLANLSPIKALLVISDSYLNGEDTLANSVHLARRRGGLGEYFAGEMSLQAAFDTKQKDLVNKASVHFKRAASAGNDPLMYYGLRSKFRLAQLGLFQSVAAGNQLPTRKNVLSAYAKMVDVGHDGLSNPKAELHTWDEDNALPLVGTTTEIAVGILAMREAKKIDSDIPMNSPVTWLPLQSTFRQDHGNSCLEARPNAWDLSIWTELNESGPEISYKVQIKTNKATARGTVPDSPDIVALNVLPDLALRYNETSIGRIIIMNAFHELNNPTQYDRITNDLNFRGTKLLDALDK